MVKYSKCTHSLSLAGRNQCGSLRSWLPSCLPFFPPATIQKIVSALLIFFWIHSKCVFHPLFFLVPLKPCHLEGSLQNEEPQVLDPKEFSQESILDSCNCCGLLWRFLPSNPQTNVTKASFTPVESQCGTLFNGNRASDARSSRSETGQGKPPCNGYCCTWHHADPNKHIPPMAAAGCQTWYVHLCRLGIHWNWYQTVKYYGVKLLWPNKQGVWTFVEFPPARTSHYTRP